MNWIKGGLGLKAGDRALIGIDSAYGFPFVDKGAFFPEFPKDMDAVRMWGHVEELCSGNEDLYGGGFVTEYRDHYHLTKGGKGKSYQRRLRLSETLSIERGHGPCESVFHLIGPSQVGLSALSTMRMLAFLHHQDHIAVWPFAEAKGASIVMVEIYAALFAHMAGHRGKVRDGRTLSSLLNSLGSQGGSFKGPMDDHTSDAMLTSAGLRFIAAQQKYWKPEGLSDRVRQTEGWIFGIE
jgi:hypothetical protein